MRSILLAAECGLAGGKGVIDDFQKLLAALAEARPFIDHIVAAT